MGIIDNLANIFSSPNGKNGSGTVAGVENYNKMQGVLGTLDALTKSAEAAQGASSSGRMSPLGLDAIIQDWVRQQFIYRRSILQDLFVLAFQVTEIRSVVLSIQREVFRRGFSNWTQNFARKCIQCGEESSDEDQEDCDKCFLYEIQEQVVIDERTGSYTTKTYKKYKRMDGKKMKRKYMMVYMICLKDN